jgi:transposase
MNDKMQEQIALHRWAVIAEAASARLTGAERGALVRQIAAREHAHPDGQPRRYSRRTIDRWIRAHRGGGLDALRPSPRADTGTVRAHPELFSEAAALRLEVPGRSAAQIASILFHRHGVTISERTVRGQLRCAGLHREACVRVRRGHGRLPSTGTGACARSARSTTANEYAARASWAGNTASSTRSPARSPQRRRSAAGMTMYGLDGRVTMPPGSRRAMTTPASAARASRSPGRQPSALVMARSATRPGASIRPNP